MESKDKQEIKEQMEGEQANTKPITQPTYPYQTYSYIPSTVYQPGSTIPIQTAVQPQTIVPQSDSQMRESIKGESRIEYIPYEKTIIEYEAVQKIERIPRERKVIEYEEVTRIEYIPKEKKITDYYAVEYQTEYIPQVYQDKYIEYIPQEKVQERVEYQAIEKQIVHQPVIEQGQQQASTSQVQYVQQPLAQSIITQPVTYVQQPLAYSYVQSNPTILPPTIKKTSEVKLVPNKEEPKEKKDIGFFESLFQ